MISISPALLGSAVGSTGLTGFRFTVQHIPSINMTSTSVNATIPTPVDASKSFIVKSQTSDGSENRMITASFNSETGSTSGIELSASSAGGVASLQVITLI